MSQSKNKYNPIVCKENTSSNKLSGLNNTIDQLISLVNNKKSQDSTQLENQISYIAKYLVSLQEKEAALHENETKCFDELGRDQLDIVNN